MQTFRPSRVLRKLRAGEVASCTAVGTSCPRVVEIAAGSGIDCVWLCMEHRASDLCVIERQIYAAKTRDVDVVVRVPKGSYSDYIRPLELDAAGIMVPHLMSAAEARELVHWTRFHPLGRRPLDGGNQDGFYAQIRTAEYISQANRERFIIVQIEDPEPLDELDEICQVEGIDIILFGPGDFSHSIGVSGQKDHPRVVEVRKLIAATANKYGKVAGTVGSPDTLQGLIDMGYRFINLGADVLTLGEYYNRMAAAFGLSANPPAVRPG